MEQLSSTSYSGPSRREILGTCSITGRMESDGIFRDSGSLVDENWLCCVEYFNLNSDAAGQGHCRSVPN